MAEARSHHGCSESSSRTDSGPAQGLWVQGFLPEPGQGVEGQHGAWMWVTGLQSSLSGALLCSPVFSLISQSTMKRAGFIPWQFRACFLACASSRLRSVMAMICCRTPPVSGRGGVPGARRGAGDGGAGRGGRLTWSRRAWRARADVIDNCPHLCGAPSINS